MPAPDNIRIDNLQIETFKIELRGVGKTYLGERNAETHAVEEVSLSVRDGEFVALVGPSGCGKSTLLNMMAGFDRPSRGEVLVDGAPVSAPSRKGIVITQRGSVFPWMTVLANLHFGARGMSADEVERLCRHYIELVGLAGFEDAFPHQLSGGMLQRVEVARALMAKPDVLYMDEPFGALDALTRMRMRAELLTILARDRHTCILVTHDVEEALYLADRIIVMSPRPGRVLADLRIEMPHPRMLSHPALISLKERVLRELGLSALDILRDSSAPLAEPAGVTHTPAEHIHPHHAVLSLRPSTPPQRIGDDSVEQIDVIVIGGGPAGSSAAAVLAEEGLRTLVLEREHFPRYHVGESLLPATWDLFDRLGVTADMEAEGFAVKRGVRFMFPGWDDDLTLETSEYPEYFSRSYCYHVERARFDEILLHNARDKGAEVREGWAVRDVLFQGDRAVGVLAGPNDEEPRTILAPMVVDATGQKSLLARKLGWRRPDPALNKLSHYTLFENVRHPKSDELLPPGASFADANVTTVESVEGGWAWYIPLRDNKASVGVVLDAQQESRHKSNPQARFDRAIASSARLRTTLAGARQSMEMHTISNISYLNDRFVGNGFVLVGDASMFIDPIFAAGVTLAMRSGVYAAEAIIDCFAHGDFSVERLETYETRIRLPMSRVFKLIYNWYAMLEKQDSGDLFHLAREIPVLRERLLVIMSGGYDQYDFESLLAAAGMEHA
jgi:FAD-dependent halogenase